MNATRFTLAALLFGALPLALQAQGDEGLLPTQMLVRTDSKNAVAPTQSTLTLQVNSKVTILTSLTPVKPSGVQIALLIDDGLSRSAGIQLNDIHDFVTSLPAGSELLIGYMENGRVLVVQPFTTDHVTAANTVRLPQGVPGESASPYFCLSDFVKRWPGASEDNPSGGRKARFIMMLTNGVDPYNGSDRITNQDSPYVAAAAFDAERAGVSVSSIYYRDAGFRGGRGSLSGQSYLQQVADSTGGQLYNIGPIDPVSIKPYFNQFLHDISETYIATFDANAAAGGKEHLVRVKLNSTVPKLKLRHAEDVRPGNLESSSGTANQFSGPAQQ